MACLAPATGVAQEEGTASREPTEEAEPRDFDEETWRELTRGLDYATDRVPSQKEQAKEKQEGSERRDQGGGFNPATGNLIMKLFVAAAGVILLLLLVRTLLNIRRRPRDKKFNPKDLNFDIRQIEAQIHESDLGLYIRQAEEQGNFALAVRLHYLAVLKELSGRKLIRWKKDKTNQAYRQEMNAHALAAEFDRLTREFERVWYGSDPLSKSQYDLIEPHFTEFMQKIKTAQTASGEALTATQTS